MSKEITGALFKQMILHGAAAITAQKQAINDLNVFPVPDGDTGTNMSMTIATAAEALRKAAPASVGQASSVTASALLQGARGNSGVILSLLFRGLSKALKGMETADAAAFAAAMQEGVAAAYKAVMKPAEGTVLTVSRLAAKRAVDTAAEGADVEATLAAAIEEGYDALAQTTDMNPVLKKAGVVDAGGKGWCFVLEAMLLALRGEDVVVPKNGESAEVKESADFSEFADEDITFTYCTEFIVGRDPEVTTEPNELRLFLETLGDCVVVVDDEEIIKVHVHTEQPGVALTKALEFGSLLTVKIENMKEQHKKAAELNNANRAAYEAAQASKEEKETLKPVSPEEELGFVSVAAGDGLRALFEELGCAQVVSGGQTMNPSTEDIVEAVLATPAKTVFVLPNNKNIILAAEQAVPLVTDRKIIVVPTRTIPQGLSALLSFDPDASADENASAMLSAAENVATGTVTFAARDSEFGGFKIKEGDTMGMTNGKLEFVGDTPVRSVYKVAKALMNKHTSFITLIYGEGITEEEANEALRLIKNKAGDGVDINLVNGGQPVYYFILSVE